MYPWLWLWSLQWHFPLSGDVTQSFELAKRKLELAVARKALKEVEGLLGAPQGDSRSLLSESSPPECLARLKWYLAQIKEIEEMKGP